MNDRYDIQDFTAELLDRYDDVPEIYPTAAEYPEGSFSPIYPFPNGIEGGSDDE